MVSQPVQKIFNLADAIGAGHPGLIVFRRDFAVQTCDREDSYDV